MRNRQNIFILLIILILFIAVLVLLKKIPITSSPDQEIHLPMQSTQPTAIPEVSVNPTVSDISPDERAQIDVWIEKNDLNFYGDPEDSMYAGGTPLFDESTGTYTDRYDYIIRNHPDSPWKQ